MIRDSIVALLLALAAAVPSWAGEAQPAAADPALEERMMALASELRCLVCQNETLADSQASLAADLRDQIREKMRQGASDRDIVDYLVARYGDFVLYRPPLKPTTVLLWAGPFLLLIGGMVALLFRLSRRGSEPETELSEEERARAAELLGAGRGGDRR